MSANLRNSIRRREHRERAQPHARKERFGLLEKHKDYVQRARDFHKKQDRIQSLRGKARTKNQDEFYHAMIGQQTKAGLHIKHARSEQFSADVMKILKSQDLKYIKMQRDAAAIKIRSIQSDSTVGPMTIEQIDTEISGLTGDKVSLEDEEDDVSEVASNDENITVEITQKQAPKHTFFVESAMDRREKLTKSAGIKHNEDIKKGTKEDRNEMKKLIRFRLMKRLKSWVARHEALSQAETELQLQNLLSSAKGKRHQTSTDTRGNPIYKWRAERQK